MHWDKLEGTRHPSNTLTNGFDILVAVGSSAMAPDSTVPTMHTLEGVDLWDPEGCLEFSLGQPYHIDFEIVYEGGDLLLFLLGV